MNQPYPETRYITIKIITLGYHATDAMKNLWFIEGDTKYTIGTEDKVDEKRLRNYCQDIDIVYVVADLRDTSSFVLQQILGMLENTKTKVLTIVQNSDDERLVEHIGKLTSILELNRQREIHDLAETVSILYFLMYERIETVRVQEEEFSSKITLDSFFERHLQLYLYTEDNANSLTQMIMEDEKEKEKFCISMQCWLGFPKIEGEDFGGESISELIESIEETVPEDTTIYMYPKNRYIRPLLQVNKIILLIGI